MENEREFISVIRTAESGTALSENERLQIVQLLVKAGYTCRVRRENPTGKTAYSYRIEYWSDKT